MIGSNGEIILVETKLLRNPESTRQVVAQIIDYIKAFSAESVDDLAAKVKPKATRLATRLETDINFSSLVSQNIRTGNFQVLIVGDYIHPNVLGMVKSIHSAPHLAFTIYLVDLNTYHLSENEIIINPRIVSATKEIERSVIRIDIEPGDIQYQIHSEVPEEEGKGSKPILSWIQYLDQIAEPDLRGIIQAFRKRWVEEISDSINMGVAGFSVGIQFDDRRVMIHKVYYNRIPLLSERQRLASGIPQSLYQEYLAKLKTSPILADNYLSSGKVEVKFEDLDNDLLQLILDAAFSLAKRFQQTE
jgi:hypothetical protein